MELFSTDRARFAANTLLAVEIAFGTLAFWSHAAEKNQFINYLVAGLLTAFFGGLSVLAAGVVTRAVAAKEAQADVTRVGVVLAGIVIALVSGFMTWHGLTWADSVADLVPGTDLDGLLIVAAVLLSALNLVNAYLFCRDLKPVRLQPQLVHFPVQVEEQTKNPHAQAMAYRKAELERERKAANGR